MPIVNQAAHSIGQLSERLAGAYYSQRAMLMLVADNRANRLAPAVLPGHSVPIGRVARKDGTEHAFHYSHFLEKAKTDQLLADQFEKVWLAGALVTLGDELQAHSYFDRAPELEMVYHLRNGIAHGNRFNITQSGAARLLQYPAHNRLAWVQSDTGAQFEISMSLQGSEVLFGFMGAGDVLDLLMSVGLYCMNVHAGPIGESTELPQAVECE